MQRQATTEKHELAQDAHVAAELGPPTPGTARTGVTPFAGTPRWLLAWLVPVAALVFLYMARHVLAPFVIAAVIVYIFSIFVDNIQDRIRWPRWVLVTALYLLVLGILGVGLYFGAEALYRQTAALINSGPNVVETALRQIIGNGTITFAGLSFTAGTLTPRINAALSDYFGTGGASALGLGREALVRLLDSLLVIIVSFYLLLDSRRIGAYFLKFVPADSRTHVGYVTGRINTVLTAYLRGQLLLILIMAAAAFVVLLIFGTPYALPLAILTGFLEILPLLGPAIATVLAAGVTLGAQGPGAALGVVIAYIILRQVEDQLVMPNVVGRAVELHPVVTIFAVLAGGAIAGPLGMLLAVPAAAAIKVILDFLYPDDTDQALAQAQPGIQLAAREAEARDEEPAPVPAKSRT